MDTDSKEKYRMQGKKGNGSWFTNIYMCGIVLRSYIIRHKMAFADNYVYFSVTLYDRKGKRNEEWSTMM